jgi:hypothetical protein
LSKGESALIQNNGALTTNPDIRDNEMLGRLRVLRVQRIRGSQESDVGKTWVKDVPNIYNFSLPYDSLHLFPSLSGYLIIWISSFFFFPHGYSGSQKNPGFPKPFFSDSIFFRDRDFKFPRYPSSSIPCFLFSLFIWLSDYLDFLVFLFPPWLT